jgi:hypothetical protein
MPEDPAFRPRRADHTPFGRPGPRTLNVLAPTRARLIPLPACASSAFTAAVNLAVRSTVRSTSLSSPAMREAVSFNASR